MSNCKCEHWQICPVCKPDMYTQDGRLIEVTREMIWCGCPLLYDGGLCANRELEETEFSVKHKYTSLLEIGNFDEK